jgi:hypothetical protein
LLDLLQTRPFNSLGVVGWDFIFTAWTSENPLFQRRIQNFAKQAQDLDKIFTEAITELGFEPL